MARHDPQTGFTLVELVLVTVVVSTAALVFSAMVAEAVRSYRFVDVEKDLLQEARYAEERMTREIAGVPAPGRVLAATSHALRFVAADSSVIAFSWDGRRGGDLLYTRNGVASPLAGGVDSLAFQYRRADGALALPVIAPAATDIRRVTFFLRLARGDQSVDAIGAAFLRAL
jgi:prepilin-type N-terminal cleavage/methylation domain-containing protein